MKNITKEEEYKKWRKEWEETLKEKYSKIEASTETKLSLVLIIINTIFLFYIGYRVEELDNQLVMIVPPEMEEMLGMLKMWYSN